MICPLEARILFEDVKLFLQLAHNILGREYSSVIAIVDDKRRILQALLGIVGNVPRTHARPRKIDPESLEIQDLADVH